MSLLTKKTSPSETMNSNPPVMPTTSRSPSFRSSSSKAPVAHVRSPSGRGNSGLSRPRGSGRRPSPNPSALTTNTNVSDDISEEDARAENAGIMEELRDRLRKAEIASEEYQRHLSMLQTRLDDSLHQQGTLEDRVQEGIGRIEELEFENNQSARQKRELECQIESERTTMTKDKNEQKVKEEELLSVNQRLKETLAQREMRYNVDEDKISTRSPSFPSRASSDLENGQFAPPSSIHRSDSKNTSNLLIQKDRLIEALRLELAEVQIKLVEMENTGGGRLHELEKSLLDARITNARLMEDNESFQLLLSEKTLNGDFSKAELMHSTTGLGSLAEELESAEGESENYRRLEIDAKSLRDQNKALTLYIENIIGRLLQHKEFENILDKTPDLMSSIARPSTAPTDKELPPPPPAKDDPPPSILQRARSVVGGPARRPRPGSQVLSQKPSAAPGSEEPPKAPAVPPSSQPSRDSIHRRSQSDMAYAAPLVNQMYRGPPSTGSGGPKSPGLTPSGMASRNSYFTPPASNHNGPSSRTASASRSQEKSGSSSNSTFSDHSVEAGNPSSPPRMSTTNNYTGAVMTQSKLRPLRLVQENREVEGGASGAGASDEADLAARKKANRSSWIPGWMNRGKLEDSQRTVSGESNAF